MKHLVTIECTGTIPISKYLVNGGMTPEEADELESYVRTQGLDEENIIITRHDVKFINYVGFIQLRSCSIEILPKVKSDDLSYSRRVLLRMLQRSGMLDVHESQLSQIQLERMNLLEILAYLYTNRVSLELRKGIYRSYQREQGELHLVRGKIDINRQIRREATMQSGVSCIYDDFQMSHPLNQVLKAALQLVVARCRYTETRKLAGTCLALLDDVVSASINNTFMDQVFFDRTNRRFQPSFGLAKMLLSQSAPAGTVGESRSSSILFKMNELFEAYVAYLAQGIWDQVTIKDHSYKLLVKEGTHRGVFQLEPDLLIVNHGGRRIIVDTKWKLIDSHRPRHGVKREDFYQMYAYLTRYQEVSDVILLYPNHDGIRESGTCLEAWHLEGEPEKRIRVCSICYEDEQKAERELRGMIDCII